LDIHIVLARSSWLHERASTWIAVSVKWVAYAGFADAMLSLKENSRTSFDIRLFEYSSC